MLLVGFLGIPGFFASATAEELSREKTKFLKDHAPRLLEMIAEAKEEGHEEVLEEALYRTLERQLDAWEETSEGDDEQSGPPIWPIQ